MLDTHRVALDDRAEGSDEKHRPCVQIKLGLVAHLPQSDISDGGADELDNSGPSHTQEECHDDLFHNLSFNWFVFFVIFTIYIYTLTSRGNVGLYSGK